MISCHKCGSRENLEKVSIRQLGKYQPNVKHWYDDCPMAMVFYTCAEHSVTNLFADEHRPSKDEVNETIHTLADQGKVVFAESTLGDQLRPFMKRISHALGYKAAWWSDDSTVSVNVKDERELLSDAAKMLGVEIDESEPVVEIARRLAQKEGALS